MTTFFFNFLYHMKFIIDEWKELEVILVLETHLT